MIIGEGIYNAFYIFLISQRSIKYIKYHGENLMWSHELYFYIAIVIYNFEIKQQKYKTCKTQLF